MTEDNKKKYYCPDTKCKHYKVYMSAKDNWVHLIAKHNTRHTSAYPYIESYNMRIGDLYVVDHPSDGLLMHPFEKCNKVSAPYTYVRKLRVGELLMYTGQERAIENMSNMLHVFLNGSEYYGMWHSDVDLDLRCL